MDLDGVLHNYNEAFVRAVKKWFDIELRPSDSWSSFSDQLVKEHGRKDAWNFMWNGGVVDYFLGQPYEGAIEACREIDSLADLVLLTSRPPWARTATYWWLADHGVPTSEVHLITTPKSTVHCDLYVDDGSHNVRDLVDNTPSRIVLWDQPWNQDFLAHGRVTRTHEWSDVIEIVRSTR